VRCDSRCVTDAAAARQPVGKAGASAGIGWQAASSVDTGIVPRVTHDNGEDRARHSIEQVPVCTIVPTDSEHTTLTPSCPCYLCTVTFD
jgi:hypothetical protein